MNNENEKEKKGLFGRLFGNSKSKGSCCGNFELEEIPEEHSDNKNEKMPKEEDADNSWEKSLILMLTERLFVRILS